MNRADLHVSSATKTTPRIPLSITGQEPKSSLIANAPNHQASSAISEIASVPIILTLNEISGLCDMAKKILSQLQYLSQNMPHDAQPPSSSPSPLPPGELTREVEAHIYTLLHSGGSVNERSFPMTITNACFSIGAYIYLQLFIKRVAISNPVYAWQLQLLKDCMQQLSQACSIASIERRWPEVWLWILVVGACASTRGGDYRALICRQLAQVNQISEIKSWDEAKSMLGRLIWADNDYGLGLEVWADVSAITISPV